MTEYINELKIRYVKTREKNPLYGKTVETPDELYQLFKSIVRSDKERLLSVHFDARLQINCYEVLSIGDSVSCLFSPKEIFKGVLLSDSSAFALIHNHPTGDCAPSDADLEVSKIIEEGARYVGLSYLDFIIIGDNEYWSLEDGYRDIES